MVYQVYRTLLLTVEGALQKGSRHRNILMNGVGWMDGCNERKRMRVSRRQGCKQDAS